MVTILEIIYKTSNVLATMIQIPSTKIILILITKIKQIIIRTQIIKIKLIIIMKINNNNN